MRSKPQTVKAPIPLIEALEHLHQTGPLREYPSKNAALVGILLYAAIFPRPHALTVAIAKLPQAEQDEIHDFVAKSVKDGRKLGPELAKPATAQDLLRLARCGN